VVEQAEILEDRADPPAKAGQFRPPDARGPQLGFGF
jgi:hypothetical protein